MANAYLLKEDGFKLLLENGSGALLLEASSIPGPTVDWQAGGRGRPVRRNETEALLQSIEQTLRVALGLDEAPVPVSDGPAGTDDPPIPLWSDARFQDALEQFRALRSSRVAATQRYQRLESLLRAYDDEQVRQEALRLDDEETWMLMS